MSFREKSAWLMGLLTLAAGIYYLRFVYRASQHFGVTAPPGIVIVFVFLMIVGAVVAQVVLALSSPSGSRRPADERERLIHQRSSHWSGLVLATGAVSSLGYFMLYRDGNMLFHSVMASLIVAQIAQYGFEIILVQKRV